MLKTILKGFQTFHEKHEKLKKTVHTAWRYPLPKWGQYAMGAFYASVPIVGGWFWMQWAISKSHESIGPKGEKLRTENNNNNISENKNLISNGGDTIIRDGESIQIGAGGYLGGVRLAKSSEQDQIQSKENLERFFQKLQKQQKRNKKKKKQNDEVKEEQAEEE